MMPDVPTFREQGIDFELMAWFGLFAPKGTPQAILDTLATAATEAMKDQALRERLSAAGIGIVSKPRAEFAQFVQKEAERWQGIISTSGLAPTGN
ncbi:MAG: Bug family tripartite tricarboxylate transporter substrate binding protein [Pigmentiphaga sp.]